MTPRRCLVIGRGLIGSAIRLDGHDVVRVGHGEALEAIADVRPDLLINAALEPASLSTDQPADDSLDARYAARLAPDARYVMLSSRKVYAPAAQWAATEATIGVPESPYGRNKLAAERLVADRLGARALILRLPNVYGFEVATKRPTFFGMMLETLRSRGEIVLQFGSDTQRDFLLVDDCATLISALVHAGVSGVFNLGYGAPVACGDVAEGLIAGFGRGRIVNTRPERVDEFYLDAGRLASVVGSPDLIGNERGAFEIGRRLRSYQPDTE